MRIRGTIAILAIGLGTGVSSYGRGQTAAPPVKGDFKDVHSSHPLKYFTASPFLRDDGNDPCINCTPEGTSASVNRFKMRTLVRPVGILSGYRILDVLYSEKALDSPERIERNWKSILVEVSPGRYRELFHLQAGPVSISPSQIVKSGREKVLMTMDSTGGNGGACWEGYWWFDASGPHSLDFSQLKAAIDARVPKNSQQFGISCSNLDLESEQIQAWIQKDDVNCHACGYLGLLTAQFRLVGPVAESGEVAFRRGDPSDHVP